MASINGADSISPTVPPSYIGMNIKTLEYEQLLYLHNADVWLFTAIINRDFRDRFNPILNSIGDMRHYLNSFSQVIATALAIR